MDYRATKTCIELFNASFPVGNPLKDDTTYNMLAQCGFVVHSDCISTELVTYIKDNYSSNYNDTFYKSWNDVISKTRLELFIDQINHYASTYGTNFTSEPFIVNTGSKKIKLTNFKLINCLEPEVILEKCLSLLYSGIALKETTLSDVLYLIEYLNPNIDIDFNLVKNKEAKLHLYKLTNTIPTNPEEALRYVVFCLTGQSMIVKNKMLFNTLSLSLRPSVNIEEIFNKVGLDKMASIFYRFKPVFLALKKNQYANLNYTINAIRRLATKHHIPKKTKLLDRIFSGNVDVKELDFELNIVTNFKKVSLLNAIKIRLAELDNRLFLIRNQKVYVTENNKLDLDKSELKMIYNFIYSNLMESISGKACKISLPDNIELAVPTSQKSFMGMYPFGSKIKLPNKHAIVGIKWKGSDGVYDIDLHAYDSYGTHIGWNSSYYSENADVIYSGDMTNAQPSATELMYFNKKVDNNYLVTATLYGGNKGSKYNVFVASEDVRKNRELYMVNPNNIVFENVLTLDSRENVFGVIKDDYLVLSPMITGNNRVPKSYIQDKIRQYTIDTCDIKLNLKTLLEDAGFIITDENPDIDWKNNYGTDSLISLLS